MTLDLREDLHIRMASARGRVDMADIVRHAEDIGLNRICCVKRVNPSTTGLESFLAEVRVGSARTSVVVLAALEAGVADAEGRLALPPGLPRVDLLYVAADHLPVGRQSLSPTRVRRLLAGAELTDEEVGSALARALRRALERQGEHGLRQPSSPGSGLVLARPFSLLHAVGLSASCIPVDDLVDLVQVASQVGATVEASEQSPGFDGRLIRAFAAGGVPVVAGSEATRVEQIGCWRRLRALAGELDRRDPVSTWP